jgi:predicted GNAT family acetyltransferase
MPETAVTDNPARSRYELTQDGLTAFADYSRCNGKVVIPHVEAPPELRGTGAAGRLMEGVVADVRAKGEKLVPLCPYAAAWMERHPEHADLLAR